MKAADRQTAEGILFTDQYQLSMAQLYYRMGLHEKLVQFDHFFRDYPDYSSHRAGYCINAGLEWFGDWLREVRFREEDIAYLRSVPNIILMAPKDEGEMRDMLFTMTEHVGPAAMRYPRGNGIGVSLDREPELLEIGKGELLRDGGEVAIVAYGSMVHPSLEAAANLAKDGIETTVVNARFVKPLDSALLLALARTKRLIVTVEEAYLAGGFGAAVLELLEENGLQDKVRVVRMGVPDRIVTHGDAKLLLAKYGLDADGIYTRVKESVEVLDDRRAKHQKVIA